MMRRQIGEVRLLHSWNRRGMEDAGCTVCCGTDLPLLIPSLGESVFSACGGFFADGLSVNEGNTLTIAELLRAWTVSSPTSVCSIAMCLALTTMMLVTLLLI